MVSGKRKLLQQLALRSDTWRTLSARTYCGLQPDAHPPLSAAWRAPLAVAGPASSLSAAAHQDLPIQNMPEQRSKLWCPAILSAVWRRSVSN